MKMKEFDFDIRNSKRPWKPLLILAFQTQVLPSSPLLTQSSKPTFKTQHKILGVDHRMGKLVNSWNFPKLTDRDITLSTIKNHVHPWTKSKRKYLKPRKAEDISHAYPTLSLKLPHQLNDAATTPSLIENNNSHINSLENWIDQRKTQFKN